MRRRPTIRTMFLLSGLFLWVMLSLTPHQATAQQLLGGEFALNFGASTGPFRTETDFFISGTLDVPLLTSDPLFGQALLGEVMVGWGRTSAQRVSLSPLWVVGAPQGAVTSTDFEVTTLQVALDFKYKIDKPFAPIAPYVVFGPSFYVFLGKTSGSPLGEFVGGIAPQPEQLQGLNFPSGQGNVEIGANLGVGVDVHVAKRLILGAEYRYNAVAKEGGSFSTFGGKIGLRF